MRRRSTVLLAGWLFADSMLAMMLVGLAADPGRHRRDNPSSRIAVRDDVVRKAVRGGEHAGRGAGVESQPVVVALDLSGGRTDTEVQAQVVQRVGALVGEGRRAAFVLTFGTAPAPGQGVGLARRANTALLTAAPELFAGSARRDFWQSANPDWPSTGLVKVEIYLFHRGV